MREGGMYICGTLRCGKSDIQRYNRRVSEIEKNESIAENEKVKRLLMLTPDCERHCEQELPLFINFDKFWIAILPKPRLRYVLELRFGLCGRREHTLEETAKAIGITSRERVRQLEARALRKIRGEIGKYWRMEQ